jgi:hypothetical protein
MIYRKVKKEKKGATKNKKQKTKNKKQKTKNKKQKTKKTKMGRTFVAVSPIAAGRRSETHARAQSSRRN